MTDDSEVVRQTILSLKKRYPDHNTQSFDLADFTFAFGSPLDAFLYAKLFWPDFIEFSGMIFHSEVVASEADRERVRQMISASHSPSGIEQSFNQFDVPSSFFGKYAGDTSDSEDLHLARIICDLWKARLLVLFPNRNITVKCSIREGSEPSLSVFQAACEV